MIYALKKVFLYATGLLLALLCIPKNCEAREVIMTSPDGKYVMRLSDVGGHLRYDLQWGGTQAIEPSSLGIKANTDWRDRLSIREVETSERDTVWHPVYGERATVRDHYREYRVSVSQGTGQPGLQLVVRAYNEGVAFKYLFLGSQYLTITSEHTQFTMPDSTVAYVAPYAQSAYSLLPLRDWHSEAERPLLLHEPSGLFVALAEARMTDYCRTKFKLAADKINTISTSMYGPVEDIAPYSTPWRVIMCAQRPLELLQHNDIILNLNDPCRLDDTSWIRPGKVMREMTLSTEGAKALVDFAVKHHIQYIHFDAGWYGYENDRASDATTVTLDPRRNPDPHALDLPAAISYARSHGVGVILYVNMRALEQQLDDLLPLYESWGVSGIKFGFVEVGSQTWTRWLHDAVRKCARHHLMVDIHDEYRPTGFSRTYPNLMTQEGIRGNEEFPDGRHNTILPFTRFLAGAADYTICYYRQDWDRLEGRRDVTPSDVRLLKTTPAHQLALSLIYYSPWQFVYWYDRPSDTHDEPELKFFDDLYTTWDDTRVLDGAPGESVTIARRKGNEWFVGAITNNEARKIELNLDFLELGKNYQAEIYTDGGSRVKTRTHVLVSRRSVRHGTKLHFKLRPSGGVALHIICK